MFRTGGNVGFSRQNRGKFMESSLFRSDLVTGHEPSRTRDEDEDEDEKRGQLPPIPHSRGSGPRMGPVVGFLQAFGSDMGVNLRGHQVGVPE